MKLSMSKVEMSLLAGGAALCLFYLAANAYRSASSRLAVQSFEAAKSAGEPAPPKPAAVELPDPKVSFHLWGTKRVAAYRDSLRHAFGAPIAVLRAPKIGVEVAVFDGTDELTLNRGVGRVPGTARPGEPGNLVIAGHRDGFFRALKDISVGDPVTLDLGASVATYVVESIRIVSPSDVTVLAPTPGPTLTLVTCYPFYFVGAAPRRYIVRCALEDGQARGDVARSAVSR